MASWHSARASSPLDCRGYGRAVKPNAAEIVALLVGVAAPLAVAVHLNGNATVGVIGSQELARIELAGAVPAMQRDFATAPDAREANRNEETQRHVLTDGRGVPIAITITGANVHELLERVVAMLTQLSHP